MTYYTIYKITNKINGKIYIGAHQTDDLNDDYMGSGKYIKRAIKKHGIENFEKDILFILESENDMWDKEAELVTDEFVSDDNNYNLKLGGTGGWSLLPEETKSKNASKAAKTMWTSVEYREKRSKIMSKLHSDGIFDHINWSFKGKRHTEESKAKIGKANSIKQKGTGNSQYGTMWITNEKESKKILKTDPIPEGWRKGRKIK